MNDLTVVLLTANKLPDQFFETTFTQLQKAISDKTPLIIASKKPVKTTRENTYRLVFDTAPSTHINIYRDALMAARLAMTKYIAIAEDDVLYSPAHFEFRPDEDVFAYNVATWGIYTWVTPAQFHWRQRRNHNGLICTKQLYIDTLEERFAKYKDTPDEQIPLATFAEPGRYEGNLDLTIRKTQTFMTDPANIMFSHPTGMQHGNLGEKKRMGKLRAFTIPYWGTADNVLKKYA